MSDCRYCSARPPWAAVFVSWLIVALLTWDVASESFNNKQCAARTCSDGRSATRIDTKCVCLTDAPKPVSP